MADLVGTEVPKDDEENTRIVDQHFVRFMDHVLKIFRMGLDEGGRISIEVYNNELKKKYSQGGVEDDEESVG